MGSFIILNALRLLFIIIFLSSFFYSPFVSYTFCDSFYSYTQQCISSRSFHLIFFLSLCIFCRKNLVLLCFFLQRAHWLSCVFLCFFLVLFFLSLCSSKKNNRRIFFHLIRTWMRQKPQRKRKWLHKNKNINLNRMRWAEINI